MYTSLVLPALLLSIVPFTTPSALPASYDERAPAPKAVKSNLKRATTASIVEIDFEELAGGRLLTEVEIGGQGLTMMVDTGSGDLWVYGPEVEHPGKRRIYTPSKRPIAGETFLVRYGVDGKETSEGIVANDTLDIGSVSISDVPVEVATEVNTILPADGLLGMGHFNNSRPSISTAPSLSWACANKVADLFGQVGPQKLPSFADVMMSSLEAPVFTLDLQDTDHVQMTLGWIDHSRYTGELTTVPAITGFAGWVVANVSFAVNGVPMVFTQEEMAL
ncbi:MAG: hypothetical protein Q9193_004742, partial [Seirophora villosa]